MSLNLQAELIFMRMVSHLDSFWYRGKRKLGNEKLCLWNRCLFSLSLEIEMAEKQEFLWRKAIFNSSVPKNGEVYRPETSCMKRTFIHHENTWIKQLCKRKVWECYGFTGPGSLRDFRETGPWSHAAYAPLNSVANQNGKIRNVLWRDIKIPGFNQFKKCLRQITPQNKPYYFSETNLCGVRCTLIIFLS